MFVQFEELNGLTDVENQGSFGTTQFAEYQGKRVFVKQFPAKAKGRLTVNEIKERLLAELVVSSFLSRALKGIADAPEFPQYRLVANEGKIIGFCSSALSDPTNITENAAIPRFYSYLKAVGCATHAALRFLVADPDSPNNHGWDSEEESISAIDVGLAFYNNLKLEDGELGKLPERDIFEPNQLNLMQWLFIPAKNAESFSPFHAFSPDTSKLLPKNDSERNILKDFYAKYLHVLKELSVHAETILSDLSKELPPELKSATALTFSRLEQRSVTIKLLFGELSIEKLLNEAIPKASAQVPAKAFFDKRGVSSPATQPASMHGMQSCKENVVPVSQNISPQEVTVTVASGQRLSNKGT